MRFPQAYIFTDIDSKDIDQSAVSAWCNGADVYVYGVSTPSSRMEGRIALMESVAEILPIVRSLCLSFYTTAPLPA